MLATRIHPLTGQPKGRNGHARPELFALKAKTAKPKRQTIEARYDAAQTSDGFKNYWANADALDADLANGKGVRQTLVKRSRYETNNNGYADGMTQTHANYLVGTGPSLRMETEDADFNNEVEEAWSNWCNAVQFNRKLWCMAHAKMQDGEALGIVRNNPNIADPIKLDVVLVETEQCQTPYLPFMVIGYVDGIKFDAFGNPEHFDILPYHPGGPFGFNFLLQPEPVPARFVLHWYHLRRPGQHRGVPECKSTLNVGASSRRMREATVAAAEAVAAMGALMLKTTMSPDEAELVDPMSTLEYEKGVMTALPDNYDAFQVRPEQPGPQYKDFLRSQVSETGRPKNMPHNLAACDSSDHNFASGRLDYHPYYAGIDVERADGELTVTNPLFALWWFEAVNVYGWDADPNVSPKHSWGWPKHPVADIESEANATSTKLKSGATSLTRVYDDAGLDYEDELKKMARENGVTPEQMRQINVLRNCERAVVPYVAQIMGIVLPAGQNQLAQADQQSMATQEGDGSKPSSEVSGGWVTLENGTHVEIGDDGTIQSGPESMRGKTISQVIGRDRAHQSADGNSQTKTSPFKKWFGESKVVNQSGQPLVVYHGTNAKFSTFDLKHAGTGDISGHYFTTSEAAAGAYGARYIVPAYLSLKNPASIRQVEEIASSGVKTADLRSALMKRGFDGVYEPSRNLAIAFQSEQIKSATKNGGNFDPKSGNIYE